MPTLDPELDKYYQNYFDLFTHPGYKQLMTDIEGALKSDRETALVRCKTNDDWQIERGQQLRSLKILHFEASVRAKYEALTNPTEEDVDDLSVNSGLVVE